MSVVIIQNEVTPEDVKIAQQEYGDYIKIVVDIETEEIAIGGEWHADAEKELLSRGSKQSSLWGGGIVWSTKEIDFNSLINTRPNFNNSQEILDVNIRQMFENIVRNKFSL